MAAETLDCDTIIVGAGIAGASVAYFLAPHARVVLVERETHPGMHSTGRSAALWFGSYGSDQVRALTRASRPFLDTPPPGFTDHPLLTPRAVLMIAGADRESALREQFAVVHANSVQARWLDGAQARAMVEVLEPAHAHAAIHEPDAADMDVNALHMGYLRCARASGARLLCDVRIDRIERDGGRWYLHAGDRLLRAPLLLDAAGAWADEVAALAGVAPIGLQPRRRSAFLFAPPEGLACRDWPLVVDVDETFYFKPDAGLLLGSSANADPVPPHDVQPELEDVALGIERIERATRLRIRRPTRTWAGLRSFVADGDLVGGFARDAEGFFWVAAQGGYGIQTSAAMGEACAHLVLGYPLPGRLVDAGVTAASLAPR